MTKILTDLLKQFCERNGVTGRVENVPNESALYQHANKFLVYLKRGDILISPPIYTGDYDPEIPPLEAAIHQLVEESDGGSEPTFERWNEENGSFYDSVGMNPETKLALYEDRHAIFTALETLLGEDLLNELSDLVRNGEYRERQRQKGQQ